MTVGNLDVGNYRQTHEGHGDERRLHLTANVSHLFLDAQRAEGNLMTVHRSHQSADGERNIQHLLGTDHHLSALHLYNTVDSLYQILVTGADGYPTEKGSACTVNFDPVKTKAVRLEVTLPSDNSAGLFEWVIK